MSIAFLGGRGEARQKQMEEFVGVDFDGDFGVGLEFDFGSFAGGQAGFERRRAANGSVGVPDGFPGGDFSGGFNFHKIIFKGDDRGIDHLRDGERIVHGEAGGATGLAQAVEIGAQDFSGGLADGILRGFEGAHLFVVDDDFAGDVEADHSERNSGIENDARGFRVDIDVEFGRRSDVAAAQRAAHDHDCFDERGDSGVGLEDSGDVGERADGDEGDFAGIRADDAADESAGGFGDWLGVRLGKIDATEAVVAVRVFGSYEAADERSGGAGGDGDVGAAGDFEKPQGVWQG